MSGGNGGSGFLLAKPTLWIRVAAGDDEFLQRQRIGEHIGGGGTQSVVTAVPKVGIVIRVAGSVLFAAVIGERSVRAADQIKVPRALAEEKQPPSRVLRPPHQGRSTGS